MKKILLVLLSAILIICSITGCTGSNTNSDGDTDSSAIVADDAYADQTLVGMVVSLEDDTLTLIPGELTEAGEPPEIPQDDGIVGEESEDTPPDSDSGVTDKQPPEKPEPNEQGDSSNADQAPPEMPDGESGGKHEQFTVGGESVTFAVAQEAKSAAAELETDDIVRIQTDENCTVISIEKVYTNSALSAKPDGFGDSQDISQGSSANTIDSNGTYADETYISEGDDENALRIDSAEVTLDNITVNKASGATSSTEDGDFYGMNAALLATDGANVTITNSTITSSAQNGNGVFSYGTGTVVNISDSAIITTADNSGGIQTTGGGTTNAKNLKVETSGASSAAIRSDRGGGTVNVDGGSYTSNGLNSPAVYSTADITVKNAVLTANNSEALVIEGQNSITLENCTVSGNMSDTEGTSSSENVHNVMIYQSMSGDAEVGTSSFSMTGGTLLSNNGDMFYITNTRCVLYLNGVKTVNSDLSAYLLRITGNSGIRGWGNAGENGADVDFTAEDQVLEGDITVDSISTLDMTLKGTSTFTGTVNIVENEQGGSGVNNNAVITIEKGSTWTLTGNCTVTDLVNNGTINFNGYTITLADGTVLTK